MGEFELDREEKLITAANYLVHELRSGKSLTRNAKKALESLSSELSRVVVVNSEDDNRYEEDEIKTRLNAVCEKIMTREVDETMIWDLGSEAGNEFLDAVNELRVLIDGGTTEEVSLRKAHDVLQTAMARLEDEFKHLLSENKLPFELEHASFRSDHCIEEGSFGAASTEDLIIGSSRRNSEEIVIDLVRPEVISDLKNIASTMVASGYDRECLQVCTTVRKEALDEFLYHHEVEKLSIEDVLKMDWATLNTNIKKWVRVMRSIVQVYLVSEKSLNDQIFGEEEEEEESVTCFVDTVKAPVMQLLNFGEAVSLGPRQPEKLLRILEMYELASELLPEIDVLFSGNQLGSSVRGEYREVMRRLGECARATFLEFKSAIASDVSSHPFPGGAVHPLTNYVMNYLMALTDFSQTLDSLLMEHDDVEDLSIPPSPDVISPAMVVEEESAYENSSSPEKFLAMTKHFYSITSVLEANLEEKAKLYRDVSLRHIFLLNNIHYMTRKVLKSELKHIFGDKWNRKHTWKFQQQATEYERSTWLPVLSFLKDDTSGSGSGSGSRSLRPRERFQGFNTASSHTQSFPQLQTMVFVKPSKSNAYFKRYQVKFRRRRDGKTDYRARIRLINQDKNKYNTPKYRFVVRFTNKDIVAQIVSASIAGDIVKASAYAHELPQYGLTVGLTNYAAAYCTGLLLARRVLKMLEMDEEYEGNLEATGEDFSVEPTESRRPFRALLDVGLIRTTTGNRVFGALKGALDGGLDIPHSDKRFAGFNKENKQLDAEVHRNYIYGGHVSNYMKMLNEDEPEKFQTHFSQYVKKGVDAETMEELYKKVHAAIRADPNPKKTEKPAPKAHKRYNLKKLTYEERKNKLIERVKALNGAAGGDDDDEDDEE